MLSFLKKLFGVTVPAEPTPAPYKVEVAKPAEFPFPTAKPAEPKKKPVAKKPVARKPRKPSAPKA